MRGQTSLDFAVGVSVFLLALLTVFLFIPGTVDPFTEGGQEEIVATNRVAASLSEGLLGDPARPHVLNESCAVAFFEDTSPSYCLYEGASVEDRVGLGSRHHVNVTLHSNLSADADAGDLLCWTGSALAERDNCAPGDSRMAVGREPPTGGRTTVSARRVVDVGGDDATLKVVVW